MKYKRGMNPNSRNGFKKGHNPSEETRKKMSESNKGRTGWNRRVTKKDYPLLSNAGRKKGCTPWNKGKKGIKGHPISEEARKKISKKVSGQNNGMWNGGSSFEPYPYSFNIKLKKLIKERDKFKCKICKSKKCLHIHHINFIKKDCRPENLITLCRRCHNGITSRRTIL